MSRMLKDIESAVFEGGRIIRENHRKGATGVAMKARNDYVTDTDRAVERYIKEKLAALYPDIPLLTEEGSGTSDGREGKFFCLDPLDGTNNFVHALPVFCVSLALVENMRPVAGAVFDPVHHELFSAEAGEGAAMNGKRISTSGKEELDDAFIATGFPFRERGRVKEYMKGFENLLNCTGGIRRCGAAAIDLCWTAIGRFDAFWEFGLKPWDIAAGKIIVEEAGGAVSCTSGGELDIFTGDILAASTETLRRRIAEIL